MTPRGRADDDDGVVGRPPPRQGGAKRLRLIATGEITLDMPLAEVVGKRDAAAAERDLGLRRVADLVHHYPRRYATRGELTALDEVPIGEHVTIVAEVRQVGVRNMQKRRGTIVEVRIFDGRAHATLTFFGQPWRANELSVGRRGTFSGKASRYKGMIQLAHPDYELFDDDTDDLGAASALDRGDERAKELIPIYPASSSLQTWDLKDAIAECLERLVEVPDPVPADVRFDMGQPTLDEALRVLHKPANRGVAKQAEHALKFTEAFVLQTALLQDRAATLAVPAPARLVSEGGLLERFDARLPFELTGDQRAVGAEIARELAAVHPMQRLVQGEVGSGKTIVAVRAMLQVAESGGQSALLAPTEVLATQHVRSIAAHLGPELASELNPTLLTGGMSPAERRRSLLNIAAGISRIVVGTHALLGEHVSFFDLGLVVVDEQHRFGVEQRERLREKAADTPHLLVLTATPIPRTVAMTMFGDLDVSTITELPAGRAGISTHVVPVGERPAWLDRAWARIGEELATGRQAFIVCPAIDGGDDGTGGDGVPDAGAASGAEAEAADAVGVVGGLRATVESVAAEARARPELRGRTVAELHGRMSGDEKDAVMRRFAAGEVDVLVATTVIEVGVDVPNATVMMVMEADRFGVSQLHQLRGRVGRGAHAGLCLLVTASQPGSTARERVDAVAETLDGFALAERDLELRREGDILGDAQSGARSSLKLLRVARDGDLIEAARGAAGPIVDHDPRLERPEHGPLRDALARLRQDQRDYLAKS